MSTPPTISQVASFVKRAWNPMAALQAVSLGVEYVNGPPPPPFSSGTQASPVWNVLFVFSTTCKHSRSNFSGFVSAAQNFVGGGCTFLALTRDGKENAEKFVESITTGGRAKVRGVEKISVAVDLGGDVIGKLQRQFKIDTVPHCYVVKNGVVEWDGHPSSLER
ncbi:hypothetical protein TrRE_jg9407 [Triparma retinervis]|uniref:Uncharacterized protein n=1 Tax=Triparma retinervis TaxID=2557542 RepID=A0A9W7EDH0_9STRA|nr:hypothetical protein TrRE_jg9407 [Triparma retinervis]